jgi:hypothetical protein
VREVGPDPVASDTFIVAVITRVIGTDLSASRFLSMSKDDDLKKQAERAEAIAEQTVDESLKQILLNAAKDYRKKAKKED